MPLQAAEIISQMSVSQFKAYKKALSILSRAGVCYATAIDILIEAHVKRIEALNRISMERSKRESFGR